MTTKKDKEYKMSDEMFMELIVRAKADMAAVKELFKKLRTESLQKGLSREQYYEYWLKIDTLLQQSMRKLRHARKMDPQRSDDLDPEPYLYH